MKKTMLTMVLATALISNTLCNSLVMAFPNENPEAIESMAVVNSVENVQAIPQADVFNVNFSRDTADDYSINKNQYTLVGNPVIKDSEERSGKVAAFDGKSAYVYKFNDAKYDTMRTEDGVTIEATFKYDEIPSGESDIFSNQQSGGIGLGLEKGKLQFYCNVNGSYKQPNVSIEAGVWYHAVGTYDGSVAKLYLNGELVSSIDAKGSITFTSSANAKNFVIGGDSNSSNGAEFFAKGELESAKLYSKALSAEEIKAVYESEDVPVILFNGEDNTGELELNKETLLPTVSSSNGEEVKLTVTDANGAVVEVIDNKITPTVLGPHTFKYEVAMGDGKTLVSTIKRNVVAYEKAVLNFGVVSVDSINPDQVANINFHINKSEDTYVDKVEFDIVYDSNALTYEGIGRTASGVTIEKIQDGKLHVTVTDGITAADFVKYSETLKARLKFRANESFDGVETKVKYENITASYNGKEIEADTLMQDKTIKIRTDKALDLNGDGVIGVGDIALASSEEDAKAIAEKAKIQPYKHVVIVTTDGGGVSFRPDKMYYAKNNYTIPSLTDDPEILAKRNNPYAMNLFNEIAATSYTAQTEMPAISAQNYSSIIHGAEYKLLPSEYKIDNTYAGSYYFPDYGKEEDQYPSVFKTIRDKLSTSNTAAFAEWYQIVNGIIEPDSGTNLFQVANESGKSMGFFEIADYIKSDDFKDTSLLYLQSDYMDGVGHNNGYYNENYYKQLEKYDEYYEVLINSLVESGSMDDTLLIFNSDHGGTFTGHGSVNGPSDRDIQIAIVGDTIDNGKKLEGGTNHDISPLALHALRIEQPESMDGSVDFAAEAFLSQEDLVKKERSIEQITATSYKEKNRIELTLGNIQEGNEIKSIDVVINIGDNEVSKVKTEGTVLREKVEDGKLYLTVSYESVTEKLLTIDFANDIESCKVEEYMLATTKGNEVYGDLISEEGIIIEADKTELSKLVENANKVDKTLYTDESVKVFEESLEVAIEVLNDNEALQIDVDEALEKLQKAMDSLEELEESEDNNQGEDNSGENNTEEPEDNNQGDNNTEEDDSGENNLEGEDSKDDNSGDIEEDNSNNNENKPSVDVDDNSSNNNNGNKLPQTGNGASVMAIVLGAVTSIGGAFTLKRRK